MASQFKLSLLFIISSHACFARSFNLGTTIFCLASSGIALVYKSKQCFLYEPLKISYHNNEIYINKKKITQKNKPYFFCKIFPQKSDNFLWINGIKFKGPCLLTISEKDIFITECFESAGLLSFSREAYFVSRPNNCSKIDKSLLIRVLLLKITNKTEPQEIMIESQDGFLITYGAKNTKRIKNNKLCITFKNNSFFINNHLIDDGIYQIKTDKKGFFFNKKLYKGSLIIVLKKKSCLLINQLDLEEYVYAVLRSESWPGWSLEVNKVLAIACRSYAIALMIRAPKNAHYHVKSSNIHQQYNLYGEHNHHAIRQAVEATKNMCLMYDKKPVLAMFDSCCGGLAPGLIDDFDFKKAPYLARSYPCHYCKKSSLYEWKIVFSKQDLIELLKNANISLHSISHIAVAKRDKAGIVKSVKIKDKKKEIVVSGKRIYSIAKEIKSFSFSITYKKDVIEFIGNGYGHHIGLCQWGACEMVRQGWKFDEILKFYYPATELKVITLKGD